MMLPNHAVIHLSCLRAVVTALSERRKYRKTNGQRLSKLQRTAHMNCDKQRKDNTSEEKFTILPQVAAATHHPLRCHQ